MMRAESVQFVADENGWEMHVTDDLGVVHRFNIHGVAWQLFEHMQDTIGDWRREGLAAAGLCSSRSDLTLDCAAALVEADYDLIRDMARGK